MIFDFHPPLLRMIAHGALHFLDLPGETARVMSMKYVFME